VSEGTPLDLLAQFPPAPFVGAALLDHVTPNGNGPKPDLSGIAATFADAQRRKGTAPIDTSQAVFEEFDFDGEDDAPRYLVAGLIEREFVNLIASDTGVGKTWIGLALTVAALRGETWLGREVYGRRVLVVDEENPRRVIKSRLRALGLTNEDREGLRYANRQGIAIGTPEWNEWLRENAREHRAELIIVDTATAATNVADGNDNNEVTRLYRSLRAIAVEVGAAILILHHERKPSDDRPSKHGFNTMGARQWVGQADVHLTLSRRNDVEPQDLGEGRQRWRTEAVLRQPKLRDRISGKPELVAITSEVEVDREHVRLLTASVESEGTSEAVKASEDEMMLARIIEALRQHETLGRTALAEASGTRHDNGTFKRALAEGMASERIAQPGGARRPYTLGPEVEPPL
jgi:hypothetical protein